MKMKRLLSCIAFICCLTFVAAITSSCAQEDDFSLQKDSKKTKTNPDDLGSGTGNDPSIK